MSARVQSYTHAYPARHYDRQAACEKFEIVSDKKKRVILEHAQLDDVRS